MSNRPAYQFLSNMEEEWAHYLSTIQQHDMTNDQSSMNWSGWSNTLDTAFTAHEGVVIQEHAMIPSTQGSNSVPSFEHDQDNMASDACHPFVDIR